MIGPGNAEGSKLYQRLVGTRFGLQMPPTGALNDEDVETIRRWIDEGAEWPDDVSGETPAPILDAATTALMTAALYGDAAKVERSLKAGANPNGAQGGGVTPLMLAAPDRDKMKRLLDAGADPNQRVSRKVWYTNYNFDQSGVDEAGATPFWRAAYGADVDAMKLLVSYGADPAIPTIKPPERPEIGDVGRRESKDVSGLPPIPTAGPGVPALLAAAGVGYGEGFAGNSHRHAPGGMLAAVRYLVEELGADVNARDHEGSTAVHHAASRGDTEMIRYLVGKGADVKAVNREGQTTIDLANGPVQRVQPWPETIKYLESLGAKNNHRCMSC